MIMMDRYIVATELYRSTSTKQYDCNSCGPLSTINYHTHYSRNYDSLSNCQSMKKTMTTYILHSSAKFEDKKVVLSAMKID